MNQENSAPMTPGIRNTNIIMINAHTTPMTAFIPYLYHAQLTRAIIMIK